MKTVNDLFEVMFLDGANACANGEAHSDEWPEEMTKGFAQEYEAEQIAGANHVS